MDWYTIHFDDTHVYREVEPPSGTGWTDKFAWADVIRVCYEPGDLFESDTIYVFTNERAESYMMPTEAEGGAALWGEIVRRGLFPAAQAIKVLYIPGVSCWPPLEEDSGSNIQDTSEK